MRARHWLLSAAILSSCLTCSTSAQEAVRWQANLETAKRLALQTNRLVLVHFWASWCGPCKGMDQEVFSRPEVATALEANFVPVKINVDHFPQTARQYGITNLPSDVIITPGGQLVEKYSQAVDSRQFLARLDRVLSGSQPEESLAMRSRAQLVPSQVGPAPEERTLNRPNFEQPTPADRVEDRYPAHFNQRQVAVSPAPRYGGLGEDRFGPQVDVTPPPIAAPMQDVPPEDRLLAPGAGLRAQVAVTPEGMARDSQTSPTPQLPPGCPPVGLDGFCPVQLTDFERWVQGDPRWGLTHRGRTYLFTGPGERNRFDSDPDKYAPVLSGNDLVLAVEQGMAVVGQRRHGAWFEGRVYLFSSETTLEKFDTNPARYIAAMPALNASLPASSPGQPRF